MTAAEALGVILEDASFHFADDGLASILIGDALEIVIQQGEDDFKCIAWAGIADAACVTQPFLLDALRFNNIHKNDTDIVFSLDSNANLIVGRIALCMSELTITQAEKALNRFVETCAVMKACISAPAGDGRDKTGPIGEEQFVSRLA